MFRQLVVLITIFFAAPQSIHGQRLQFVTTPPPPTRKLVAAVTSQPAPVVAFPSVGKRQGGIFNPQPSGPNPSGALCDLFVKEDCGPGFKCVPENPNAIPRCRPLVQNPQQVGDDGCEKLSNGGDTCDEHGMCIHNQCRKLCPGEDPGELSCIPGKEICHFYGGGAAICEEVCHPLFDVCFSEQYCSMDTPASGGSASLQPFTCMFRPEEDPSEPTQSLGMDGDHCVRTSDCEQGWVCIRRTSLKFGFCKANTQNCCTRLATDVNNCPDDFELVPFFANPPPGFENLSICVFVIFS